MAQDAANLLAHLGIARADVDGLLDGRDGSPRSWLSSVRIGSAPPMLGGIGMSLVDGRGGEDAIAAALRGTEPGIV